MPCCWNKQNPKGCIGSIGVFRPNSSADDSEKGFFLAARRCSSSCSVPLGQNGRTSSASLVLLCTMSALPSILGAYTYDVHTGGGVKKAPNFADFQYKFFGQSVGDDQKISKNCADFIFVSSLAAHALEHGGVVERVVEVHLLLGGDLVLGGVAGQPLQHVRLARPGLCDHVDRAETAETGRETISQVIPSSLPKLFCIE